LANTIRFHMAFITKNSVWCLARFPITANPFQKTANPSIP
jgi:hypothetical protein